MSFENTAVPPDVLQVAKTVSEKTGINAKNLLWIFWHESGYDWQIVSNWGNFSTYGLIQFTTGTAVNMGLDRNRLVSDLSYQTEAITNYYKGIQNYAKISDAYDLALANFYPAALNKPLDWNFPENVISYNRPMFVFGTTKEAYFKYLETKFPNTYDFWSKKKS